MMQNAVPTGRIDGYHITPHVIQTGSGSSFHTNWIRVYNIDSVYFHMKCLPLAVISARSPLTGTAGLHVEGPRRLVDSVFSDPNCE